MNKSFALTKKFRYGSVATVFTVMFVAVVIVMNVITTALANKYLWYIDMTKEQIFSLSQEAIDYIGDLGDREINIYFCQEADKVELNTNLKMVYNLALELEKEFPQIKVQCLDVVKNMSFFQKFKTTATTQIPTTSVIIESGTEFRPHTLQSFFVQNEDGKVWAFNGEAKFAASILSLTSADAPKAYFTTDHGEDLQSGSFAALGTLLIDSGYEVLPINLAKEELPEDARIVIINSPIYDFMGADAEEASGNEIDKLDTFLDRFGALLVFADPDHAGALVNLNEFLEEWGIAFTPNTYVKDLNNSVTTDGQSIVTSYTTDTLGASLYTDISKLGGTMPKTIVRYAMPIELLFETGGGLSGSRDVSAVLLSSPEAQVIENGEVIEEGVQQNLMTISRETRIIDNEYYYSYVIACGSSNYSNYLVSNTYANRDILYSAMRATGKEKVPAEFKYKVFETHNLDITTAESNQWTIMLTIALPAVIGICGAILHVKRKHA
jgi:ABC-type uncharacterized transport system.